VASRPDGEEGVRVAAVLALHQLHAAASYASPFLYGIFESTKLALDWIVDVDPERAVRLMREAKQRQSFVKFARRLALEPDEIKFLEAAVTRGEDAAAGILAQILPAERVVQLLSNKNRRVRSETAAWAPANPEMSEEALEKSASPLPNGLTGEASRRGLEASIEGRTSCSCSRLTGKVRRCETSGSSAEYRLDSR
jgi:hypothetical protein